MVHLIDLKFLGHDSAIGSYLIETTEGPVLVETGPHSTILALEAGLRDFNYQLTDVKHVFITHIHLDHAGASWVFAKNGAQIYLHPFGAPHMAKPHKLMESARRIYKEKMDTLWGDMKEIAEAQLHTVEHGERIRVGSHEFIGWHTPGHAKHHIAWELDNKLFCGDVAGVKILNGPVVPPCPPPDINLEHWNESIDFILKKDFNGLYLTHYGEVKQIKNHMIQLKEMLNDWAGWIRKAWESGLSTEEITPLFSKYTFEQLVNMGVSEFDAAKYEAANPSWMSVAGLIRYWKQKLG